MSSPEKQILDSILGRADVKLTGYSRLPFTETVENNNFRQSTKRYGVRATSSSQVAGVTNHATFFHTFELIITDQYFETNIDDQKKVAAKMEIRGKVYELYKDLVKSKAGLPSQVLNVNDLNVAETEFITESKVVVQRASFTVTARTSLI